jgi:outer membrane lipoprotein-sorting protein
VIAALLLATCFAADLQQDLDAVDRLATEIEAVEARFTERRYTTLLRAPMESSGTIRAVRGVVRWDTTTPSRSTTVITASEVQIFYPDDPLLEEWELSTRIGQLASSPIPQIATLRDLFEIAPAEGEAGFVTLRLTPLAPIVREHLDHIRLEIDRNTAVVIRVEIGMVDGDRTEIVFEKVKVNSGIGKKDLALEIPPDTPVVRRRAPTGKSGT